MQLIDGYSLRFDITNKTRCGRCKRWVLEVESCPRCHLWICTNCTTIHLKECKAIRVNEADQDFDDDLYDQDWPEENPFDDISNQEYYDMVKEAQQEKLNEEIGIVEERVEERLEREKHEILQWSQIYDQEHPFWIKKEREMGERFREKQELTKNDLIQVVNWKFLLNPERREDMLRLATSNDDTNVRRISNDVLRLVTIQRSVALILEGDAYRIDGLCCLDGVGPAVASTILTFYDPKRYCVFDRYVWKALFPERFDPETDYSTENYLRLLLEVRYLAGKYSLDVRTVEKAYFKKSFGKLKDDH